MTSPLSSAMFEAAGCGTRMRVKIRSILRTPTGIINILSTCIQRDLSPSLLSSSFIKRTLWKTKAFITLILYPKLVNVRIAGHTTLNCVLVTVLLDFTGLTVAVAVIFTASMARHWTSPPARASVRNTRRDVIVSVKQDIPG